MSGLPLTFASETIEFVSTTRKYNAHNDEEKNVHDETEAKTKSWMKQYEFRKDFLNENFEDYVFRMLNKSRDDDKPIIPHFTGTLQICPCPLTESYAYQALTVFMPWTHDNPIKRNRNDECLPKLKRFLNSSKCLVQLLMYYQQSLRKQEMKNQNVFDYEATIKSDYSPEYGEDMDIENFEDEDMLIAMSGMHKVDYEPDEDELLPTGLHYDWTQLTVPRSKKLMDNAEIFFQQLFVKQNRLLDIPTMVMDGKRVPFDISVTNSEQNPLY